mmetsp:Transcript_875/g.1642  ORF Transcript_875/g.1642 Transcript_875/m.1642 type:complete len:85 (-) Transcript_875:343-597(-)
MPSRIRRRNRAVEVQEVLQEVEEEAGHRVLLGVIPARMAERMGRRWRRRGTEALQEAQLAAGSSGRRRLRGRGLACQGVCQGAC